MVAARVEDRGEHLRERILRDRIERDELPRRRIEDVRDILFEMVCQDENVSASVTRPRDERDDSVERGSGSDMSKGAATMVGG